MLTIKPTEKELARFWATVEKTDGCWLCSACPSGIYSRLCIQGVRILGHVLSYVLANGFLEDGKKVCHSCDTPRCVRPDHLFAKSHSENMREMVERKRNKPKRGETNGMAKITDANALEIRNTVASGTMTAESWAEKLGTSEVSVYNCLRGATFSHIGGPRIKSTARKIYDSEICEMRWLAVHGYSNKSISEKFGIQQAVVSNYVNGKRRKDLPMLQRINI